MFPYQATNDSITIVIDGKSEVVRKGTPQYASLLDAIFKDDEAAARRALTVSGSLANYLAGLTDFSFDGETLTFKGQPVADEMSQRIKDAAVAGENPLRFLRFYARLQENPSARSVSQLWPFLKYQGIAIEEDGTFLAYKAVRSDLKDKHSGEVDNTPGVTNEMARNLISDDPREACHYGYHVGALEYAKGYFASGDDKLLICRVDPKDVVCIPYDHSAQKMRVCKYEVVGFHTDVLPNNPKKEDIFEDTGEEWEEDEDLDEDETDEEIDPNGTIAEAMDKAYANGDIDANGNVIRPVDPSISVGVQRDQAVDEQPRRAKRPASEVVGSKLRRFNKLSSKGLLDETIDDLRAYASKLKIVGASKLPGGKVALVRKIVAARRRG